MANGCARIRSGELPSNTFTPISPFSSPFAPMFPRDPAGEILRYFQWEHLPERLQVVSKPFQELARSVYDRNPGGSETMVALRKLLEAKDAAVRAALP